jgi:predicted dehydrogenase
LEAQGAVLYENAEDFFARGAMHADVLTVPLGIHEHAPVSIAALRAGLHVYCEKPLAATLEEIEALIDARDAAQKKLAVGFQHIYSNSIRQIKARICAGRLGRVQSIALLCGWPRSFEYYRRNDWAGKLRVNERWVLDGPANNAHAHYLMNMLYLASSQEGVAAVPAKLRAELYRANLIESYDTAQLQFQTEEGVPCHASFTHANAREFGPLMHLVCEKGKIVWQSEAGKTRIDYHDGASESFDNEIHPHWRFEGFRDLVYAIHNDFAPLCTPELARSHTLTINAMHASCPEIVTIAEEYIDETRDWEMFPPNTKGRFRRVRDLDAVLHAAFAQNFFLSALNVPWAKASRAQRLQLETQRNKNAQSNPP